MSWTPWASQIKTAAEAFAILKEHGLVYIAGEERTGKLLASVVCAEMCPTVQEVLVLTTKKALKGWHEALDNYESIKNITVTNYHQAKNVKIKPDLVILDECHNYLSGVPKPSGIWKDVKKLTGGLPIIYTSATPHAQGYWMLYHQFALSDWSPWKRQKTYYAWHSVYGVPDLVWVQQREVEQYKKCRDDIVKAQVHHLFVTCTRKELGFKHEPVDVVHEISLSEATRNCYNEIAKHKVYEFNDGNVLIADTLSRLRVSLHQIEGGTIKIKLTEKKSVTIDLANTEKIDFIKEKWGDTEKMCIMYHFQGEKTKLEKHFKRAFILQATSNAEGVDLSYIDHLIIYSQDYSAAKHSQRRARQANKNRDEPINVHFLIVPGAVSSQVYETVSLNKTNYVDSRYEEIYL